MTEKNIAGGLVLEGEAALEWVNGQSGVTGGPVPCFVRHEDAGGKCQRDAVMVVYGLPFCEVHGAEAKVGALEEAYYDAGNFLARLDNIHVVEPNPIALHALREAVSALREEESRATDGSSDAALRKAYPVIPERVDEDTLVFDYDGTDSEGTPIDWHYQDRMLLHKLMRLAHEERGPTWLIETLEEHRESISAQLAFALAHLEDWRSKRDEEASVIDGG